MGGIDGGAEDGEICGSMRSEAEEKSEDDPEDEESQKNRGQKVASSGLSELEVGHWDENSKGLAISERIKRPKVQLKFLVGV
jgi:hypothetical protein